MHYTLKDHQGSLAATVCGNTVERLSYDAWGRRRNPNGFGYNNVTPTFDRGFTLHEHYDDFNLINMNGRCYDPVTSSFLSVDRFVQSPDNSQSFNRYAYCMYNPLRYIDPSGWVISRPERNVILPPPDGSDFDNYVPGRITSDGFSTEYNAYTYSYNMHEVTVTASRYTWAEQWCRDYTWNRREQYSSEYSGGEVYISPTTGSGGGGSGGGNGGSSSIVQAVGITYSVIGSIFYNNTFQVWLDKQWHFRGFDEKGGRYIGGKLKYGKATSDIFKFAGNAIAIIEEVQSVQELVHSQSIEEGCEHYMDAVMGGIGFFPYVGTGMSLYWFTIGKTLHYNYANQVITPMIQQGNNPGLMIYQPFK